MRDILETV